MRGKSYSILDNVTIIFVKISIHSSGTYRSVIVSQLTMRTPSHTGLTVLCLIQSALSAYYLLENVHVNTNTQDLERPVHMLNSQACQ